MRLLFFLLLLWPSLSFCQSFFEAHEKGWFWYEKHPEPTIKKKEEKPKDLVISFPATSAMEKLQKQISETLNRAILHPTQENLLHYANIYYQVINQGQHFTNSYKMMLLKNPEYDYYLRYPINHNARLIQERQQNQITQEAVKAMAETHGFLFFFSSACQYCHVFAPTVKRFAERYGIHVMAVSMDGEVLPEFPHAVPDNGISKKLDVKSWPALFAVNPKTRQVIPLSNGVVSVSELEETVFKYADYAQRQEMDRHAS